MIEAALFQILFCFINELNDTRTYYHSGIKDSDIEYHARPPAASKYPTLRLPVSIIDSNEKLVDSGVYEARLSEDKKFIRLYESNELKASLSVAQTTKTTVARNLSFAKIESIGGNRYVVTYAVANYEYMSLVKLP